MKLYSEELLNEFLYYEYKSKPKRVYLKCLRIKKYDLANKIKIKYNIQENNDDTVTAFRFALMASTNKNKL